MTAPSEGRLRRGRLALLALVALGAVLLGCGGGGGSDDEAGGDGSSDETTTTGVAAPTGRCTVVLDGELATLFPGGEPDAPGTDDDTTCDWEVTMMGSGVTGRLHLGVVPLSFDKAVADADQLGSTAEDLDGLGDRAVVLARPALVQVVVETDGQVLAASAVYDDTQAPRPDDDVVERVLVAMVGRLLEPAA